MTMGERERGLSREQDRSEVAALIGAALSEHEVQTIVPLGDGADHWAFDVNGTFVARVRKHLDAHTTATVEREAALLRLVARVSPVPVPEVIAADAHHGLIVVRRLPGVALLDAETTDPAMLVPSLAAFIRRIHGLPPEEIEHLVPCDDYGHEALLADAAADINAVAGYLPASLRAAAERFAVAPPPPDSSLRTFCHNDLGAEHLLVDPGTGLTGIIDWSDAAIADPARDLGLLLRDLGPATAAAILRTNGTAADDPTWTRAVFIARCALFEDMAYGIGTSRPRYFEHALARMPSLFAAV